MYNIINILMILDDSSRFLMAFSMTPMSVESRVLHFFWAIHGWQPQSHRFGQPAFFGPDGGENMSKLDQPKATRTDILEGYSP